MSAKEKTIVSINGKITPKNQAHISVFDEGLMLGSGQFETILGLNHKPIWLPEHLARLEKTRKAFAFNKLYSQKQIAQFVTKAVSTHPANVTMIRLMRTSGPSARWGNASASESKGSIIVIVKSAQSPSDSPRYATRLVNAPFIISWQSLHKTLSWMPHIYPGQTLDPKPNPKSFDLYWSQKTGVTEFTSAGLLIRKGSTILAPTADHILPSVTRKHALKILSRANSPYRLKLKKISLAELFSADEIVGLSSVRLAFNINTLNSKQPNLPKSKRFNEFSLADHLRAEMLRSLKFSIK